MLNRDSRLVCASESRRPTAAMLTVGPAAYADKSNSSNQNLVKTGIICYIRTSCQSVWGVYTYRPTYYTVLLPLSV